MVEAQREEFWQIEFEVKAQTETGEVSFKKMLLIKLVPDLPPVSKVRHALCWAHNKVDPNNLSGRLMKALAGPLATLALKGAISAAAPPTVALFM